MKKLYLSIGFLILLGTLTVSSAQIREVCQVPMGWIPIQTARDLDNIRNNMAGKYFLCNDLTLTGNFTPLGWTGTGSPSLFTGTLNGNGKTIKNLKISVSGSFPNNQYIGLFSIIEIQGLVMDLQLENPEVTGGGNIGALAGISYGTVRNITVTGTGKIEAYDPNNPIFTGTAGGVIGYSCGYIRNASVGDSIQVIGRYGIGGLVGEAGCDRGNSVIWNSHSSAKVIENPVPWPSGTVGGLVGIFFYPGVILKSSASGEVRGTQYAGGLIGRNGSIELDKGGKILESFASGNVDGMYSVGGLVGNDFNSRIWDSYARGNVSGIGKPNGGVGGLIGQVGSTSVPFGQVNNCYSAGSVTGQQFVGGVVGELGPTNPVINSYFNQTLNPNLPSDDRGIGKTEQELKTLSTYLPQWDMTYLSDPSDSIWKIASPDGTGFPVLEWQ